MNVRVGFDWVISGIGDFTFIIFLVIPVWVMKIFNIA